MEATMSNDTMTALFGEVIYSYTRQQAIEDGMLVDMTEWASADKGFIGGFTCPVAMTSDLWAAVSKPTPMQDTRGRAHDVLWMASLAVRAMLRRNETSTLFRVILRVGRTTNQVLRVVVDGDGVTIGLRDDSGW
jgi:hypothetical protein